MKKNKLFITLILFISLFLNNVKALEDVENYTPQYKKYLELSDEQKQNVQVIPNKYGTSLKTYNQNKNASYTSTLPSRFSLADDYNIKVENQGREGNCWTFASLEAIETYLQIHEGITYDFSENHLNYRESYLFDDTQAYRDVNTGGNFGYLKDYLIKKIGPTLEEEFPYYNEDGTHKDYEQDELDAFKNVTPSAYATSFIQFPYLNKEENTYTDEELKEYRDKIKKHIMTNGALYTSIVGPSYYIGKYYNEYTYAAYFDNSKEDSFSEYSHAVAIIGWDDNFSKENFVEAHRPQKDGAYIVLNSWGQSFGERGIYYISYEDVYVEENLNGITEAATNPSELKNLTKIKINSKNLYDGLKEGLENEIYNYDDNTQELTFLNDTLNTIYTLRLDNKNISDLSGLENFINLESINLSNNNVTSIEQLHSLHKLTSLKLDHNKLTEVPKEFKNSELGNIDLSYNPITNFENLKEIKSIFQLDLEGTDFTNDDLELIKDLGIQSLNLAKTKTNDYSLFTEKEMSHINVSYNKNIKYETIPNVSYLSITNTDTTDEDFKKIPVTENITALNISFTNIKDMTTIPSSVETLHISGNKDLINFDAIKNVSSIYYQYAGLKDVSLFKEFTSYSINLEHNEIEDYTDLLDSENLFLDLDDNKITTVQQQTTNVITSLNNNFIKPSLLTDELIDSAKNNKYEETLKVDPTRENLFRDIAYELHGFYNYNTKPVLTNATVDYDKHEFKIIDYDKDVIIEFTDGKYEGSTITYKIEKTTSTLRNLYVDTSKMRRNYIEQETLDTTNLKVYAVYDNESETIIDDYEIIGDKTLKVGTNEFTIKKGDLEAKLFIEATPIDQITTFTFESKAVYEAVLKKIKEAEKERRTYAQFYNRLEILIDKDDEKQTITLYKDALTEMSCIEIISDDDYNFKDIKQLPYLRSIIINGKNFEDLDELHYLKEIIDELDMNDDLNVTIKNNEKINTIDKDIFRVLTIENSKIQKLTGLTKLEFISYKGTEIIDISDILDTLQVINVEVTKNTEEIEQDEEGNIILPNIYKKFYDMGLPITATITDQIRAKEYLNSANIYNIEVQEKDNNLILNINDLKNINYSGKTHYIELNVENKDRKFIEVIYTTTFKYKLFNHLETDTTNLNIEEESPVDLSNLIVYKVYSNGDKEQITDFNYNKEPITKDTKTIKISYQQDGTTSEIEIPITVTEHKHEWSEWKITKEPTTEENGLKERTCLKNENHKEIELIDKLPKQENNNQNTNNNQIINNYTNNNINNTENKKETTEDKKETTEDKKENKENKIEEKDKKENNKEENKKEEEKDKKEENKKDKKNNNIIIIIVISAIVITGIIIGFIIKRKKDKE